MDLFNKFNYDFVFGTVVRNYTKSKILKYGFNFKKIIYNFDFATSHTTGFFLKKKSIIKLEIIILNLKFQLIMIFTIDFLNQITKVDLQIKILRLVMLQVVASHQKKLSMNI